MYVDRDLWRFTRGARGRIAATVAVGLAGALVGIARLALLGWMLGLALRGAGLDRLAWPAALAALAILARGLLERARATMAHRTASAVQMTLREALHDRVMALGPAHFAGARTGAVVVTLVDGVTQLETYFGRYLPQLVVAALTTILVFGAAAAIDLPVALVLLAGAVLALAGPGALHRHESGASVAQSRASRGFAADFLDSIQGLATLKAFGQAKAQGERLAEAARELSRRTMTVLVASTATRGITDFAIAGGTAGALALGALRVRSGDLPLEFLPILLMVGVELFRPMRELRELLHQGMLGQAAAQGVLEVLAAAPAVAERAGATPPRAALAPTLAFADVHFAYPGGRVAHRGLDFAVAAGERVAIVGASGAGKTTVLRLLTRLHDVARGAVRVGGVDVRELPLSTLRAQFAIVSQDTYLFNGTVAENLRLGRPDAAPEALATAARAANALGFIEALPQGWDTPIGERGVRLSGGQRQRLAIARALLRDAPILVLDEALSAVDAENEATIQAALDRLMAGRTTLIVAHRLSSVIGADRILVLDGGRVVEQGTHRALLASGGRYAALMAAQLRDAAVGAADDRLEPEAAGDADRPSAGEAAPVAPPPPPLSWRGVLAALFGHIQPLAAMLAAVCALGIARFAAFVGVGIVGALVVAGVARGGDPTPLLAPLLLLAPAAGLLHWAESYLAHDMAYRLLADMRIALYRKLEALAPGYLLRRHSGDLVATATHDVEAVEYFFAHTAAPALVAVAVPLAVLATLAAADWRLALALLPFLAFAAFGPFRARARIDRLGDAAGAAAARMNASAVDAVQGLGEIVSFQREREFRVRFLAHAEAFHAARAPLARDLADESARLEIATGLGGLALLLAGVALAPGVAPTMLPLLVIVAMAGFAPVAEIAQTARQLAQTFASTQRLDAVHREKVTILDGPGATPIAGPGFDLAGVRFAYAGTRTPALDGIDLAVPAGRTLALVGPSGAGKTTLAMLLLRFFDPQAGRVDFRGADLRDWKLDALRAELAMVAQDTHLFNASLRRNLLLARPEADDAALDAAIRRSALAEFVAGLPDGLDTELGERGVQLSGGQRQRVAIARAFLKDAPVLILDEATSHLDAISEAEVRAALGELMRDRTVVVIAHRLSTVRDADAIAVLGAGRVLEVGRHAELLARGGAYARLVARQAAAVAD